MRIMDAIIGWHFYSMVKASDFQITSFLKIKIYSDVSNNVKAYIKKGFEKCYTLGDLRRHVYDAYWKILKNSDKYEFS